MTAQGNVLEYFGIKIDYREKGKVRMSMFHFIKTNARGFSQ